MQNPYDWSLSQNNDGLIYQLLKKNEMFILMGA